MGNKRVALLYSPVSEAGHLDSWLVLVASALVSKGFRVVCISTSKPQNLSLSNLNIEHIPFSFLKVDSALRFFYLRFFRVWQELGVKYSNRLPGYWPTENSSPLKRLQKYVFRVFVPSLYRLTLSLPIMRAKFEFINYDIDLFFRRVEVAKAKLNIDPTLVINMYLDHFVANQYSWKFSFKKCAWPWVGLKFSPNEEMIDGYLLLDSFKGQWMLDGDAVLTFSHKFPGKKFQKLPDYAYINQSAPKPLKSVEHMLKMADGRKILCLAGSISSRKNISYLLDLMGRADPNCWYFVVVGKVYWSDLTDVERRRLKDSSISRKNFLLVDEFIRDEDDFNEFIRASTLLFAVYKDFPYSSNLIGKASALKKPIMVSDKYFMGRVVREYGIGFCVDEGNVKEALMVLEDFAPKNYNFDTFNNDHSRVSFDQAIGALVESLK